MDMNKVVTKLKMTGQVVYGVNPFAVVTKITRGSQDIFRIYKYSSDTETVTQLPEYFLDFELSNKFILARKASADINQIRPRVNMRWALYVESTSHDLLKRYKAPKVDIHPNGDIKIVKVSSLTVDLFINYKGKKLNIKKIAQQIYPDLTFTGANCSFGLGAILDTSTDRLIIYRRYYYSDYPMESDESLKEVLAISDSDFSFLKILPRPEMVDISKYDKKNIITF